MKNLPLALAIVTMVGFSTTASADTVNPTDVSTFQSGTPALASEVNGTVQALITAIDDNAARIAAMEADQASPIPGDITGNTYCLFSLGSGVGAADPDPVSGEGAWLAATAGRSTATLTISSGMQATIELTADDFREAFSPANVVNDVSDTLEIELATWTLVNNLLTLTYPDASQDMAIVSADANMLVFNVSETERTFDNSGEIFIVDMIVGVRALSCN